MDYTLKETQFGSKDYNTRSAIIFSEPEKVNSWWKEFSSSCKIKDRNLNPEFRLLLKELYLSGYGFKTIAASIPEASYSQVRGLFLCFFSDIVRKGTGVVTEKLKERRSKRLLNSKENPWKTDLENKNSTGIQGRYNGYWLRSSYEYIYVKWMERNQIQFKSEPTKFELPNGQYYTPDFSIYEGGKLVKYIEIKGKVFSNNIHKPKMLEDLVNVPVEVITDINPYCEESYLKELKNWKKYLKESGQTVTRKGIKPLKK